jgi:chitinase
LTIAVSAAKEKTDALDLVKLDQLVNSYNIMSYDFTSGSWGDSHTGHQAATYSNPADPVTGRKTWSANDAAKYHVLKGASANKINIGVAFYGRGFKIANNVTPAPFVPSLGGLLTGTFETNVYDYGDLKKNYITPNNVYYDEVA